MGDKMRVLMVEPNKESYPAYIDKAWEDCRRAINSKLIEVLDLDDEKTILVCDDERSFKELDDNRIVDGNVITGSFFVCGKRLGDNGYEMCGIFDKQLEKYAEIFNSPESILQEEVQQDMKEATQAEKDFIKNISTLAENCNNNINMLLDEEISGVPVKDRTDDFYEKVFDAVYKNLIDEYEAVECFDSRYDCSFNPETDYTPTNQIKSECAEEIINKLNFAGKVYGSEIPDDVLNRLREKYSNISGEYSHAVSQNEDFTMTMC